MKTHKDRGLAPGKSWKILVSLAVTLILSDSSIRDSSRMMLEEVQVQLTAIEKPLAEPCLTAALWQEQAECLLQH